MDKNLPTSLTITSPKRKRQSASKNSEFFPYYAGFPESFAKSIIESAKLSSDALVFDPWNGSGTTTYASSQLGFNSYGIDLNPAMVIIARARLLEASMADTILLEAKSLTKDLPKLKSTAEDNDPLLQWFSHETASAIRNLEKRIRKKSNQHKKTRQNNPNLAQVTEYFATFYVALFTICRSFTKPFRSSNPTWIRAPKSEAEKINLPTNEVTSAFITQIQRMADDLMETERSDFKNANSIIEPGNTTTFNKSNFADLVLTSPPYCTRIDYTSATRVELSIIAPYLDKDRNTLSKEMIGSVKVPAGKLNPQKKWGETSIKFLEQLKNHPSKASSGYYYKTHLDYFEKMSKSIDNITEALKPQATAIFVAQDSHYKEIHNDIPKIIIEMATNSGLILIRREDFTTKNPISKINTKSKKYRASSHATESVICFKKP